MRSTCGDELADIRGAQICMRAPAPSRERHHETSAQGNAFVAAMRAAWRCAARDDIGTAALRADLASVRHATQDTRLFRS